MASFNDTAAEMLREAQYHINRAERLLLQLQEAVRGLTPETAIVVEEDSRPVPQEEDWNDDDCSSFVLNAGQSSVSREAYMARCPACGGRSCSC